jgi:hypothetical protein
LVGALNLDLLQHGDHRLLFPTLVIFMQIWCFQENRHFCNSNLTLFLKMINEGDRKSADIANYRNFAVFFDLELFCNDKFGPSNARILGKFLTFSIWQE